MTEQALSFIELRLAFRQAGINSSARALVQNAPHAVSLLWFNKQPNEAVGSVYIRLLSQLFFFVVPQPVCLSAVT